MKNEKTSFIKEGKKAIFLDAWLGDFSLFSPAPLQSTYPLFFFVFSFLNYVI